MLIRVPGMLLQVAPFVLRKDTAAPSGFLFKADNKKFMVPICLCVL